VLRADKKYFPRGSAEKDLISHYILRLAFCKTEELRRWFLRNECQLFSMKLSKCEQHEVDSFLEEIGLGYTPIIQSEKDRLRSQLMALPADLNPLQFSSMDYYKVPFSEVLPLVATRKVFLEKGFAYVSRDNISSVLVGRFRSSLSKSLTIASASFVQDDRIGPILKGLSQVGFRYGFDDKNQAGDKNDAEVVLNIFQDYLTNMGHSGLKTKPSGVSRMFISTGSRRATEQDRTCPIAGRVHKSNTQKYTVYFDTNVMMQGCWDGDCQAKNRHIFYQIQDGECVRCGWDPPAMERKAQNSKVKQES